MRRLVAGAARRAVVVALLVAALTAAGCGGGGGDTGTAASVPATVTTAAPAPAPRAAAPGDAGTRPLPPAPALPTAVPAGPAPVSLTIEALGIDAAAVRAVGVEPDGEMEVPPADEVGWYRHGGAPGGEGSSVLAAHIAYDGEDGVFRHLADLGAGDTVTVGFADGTAAAFRVTELARYPKAELPATLWSGQGPSTLSLITCGGEFDEATGHYEDNVVAHATPA